MLSNTAVPKYYGEFRDKVLRGEIPVCKKVSLEMNRVDRLIKDPRMYYDPKPVEGWIRFCENEMVLSDGSDLVLTDAFKLWGEALWGWYYFVEKSVYVPSKDGHGGHYEKKRIKKRLIEKQYLIVGRGAAKTLYMACCQAYTLTVDRSTTSQIATAPTLRQAEETLGPIQTAITKARGPLFKLLTQGSIHSTTGSGTNRPKLVSTKKGVENTLTNSLLETRPMRIDKLQGFHSKANTVDEWLSGDTREDPIVALEQGAAKVPGWYILAVSSEGTCRNGTGDTIKIELEKILLEEYYNPHVSIWWYQLDDIKEIRDPAMWIKANPNLGITVSYETYQNEVERAENSPASRNDIIAKRFGIPTEGYTYYFTYEETIPFTMKHDFWEMPCAMGADLSQGDDFCAFTFLFPLRDGTFGIKCRSYITELTLMQLQEAMRLKYEQFIDEGTLIVMPGSVLNIDTDVYDDLEQFIINSGYSVVAFGFDPYNAKEFVERWEKNNSSYGIVKVPQGARTESVPLGELKKMAEERMLIFDEELMSFCMGNCIVIEDTNGNRKLSKMRYDRKIDNVSALMDAYVAFKANRDQF